MTGTRSGSTTDRKDLNSKHSITIPLNDYDDNDDVDSDDVRVKMVMVTKPANWENPGCPEIPQP